MPVIRYSQLPLAVEDVVSSWGSRSARLASARVKISLSELLARAETGHWVQPKISFRVWTIIKKGRESLELSGGHRIFSPMLGHYLSGVSHIAAGVCTIGDSLERQVSALFASNERLQAVMLDEIGTLMLFRLCDQLEELMQEEAAQRGLDAGTALSPGHDGFDLSQQSEVVTLAGGADIGISLSSAGMLVPRKSVSFVVGFGLRMPKENPSERCERCPARERCPYRLPKTAGVTA